MKKFIFLIILLTTTELSISQNCGTILSHSVIPTTVTAGNPTCVNASVYCNSNLIFDHYTVNQTGNAYTIDAFYCAGLLTVITTTNDSFPLGNMVAGNYTYQFNVFTSYQAMSGSCTNFTITDQDSGSFSVSPATSLADINNDAFLVFPNPANEIVIIKATNKKINMIELLDAFGKVVLSDSETETEDTIEFTTSRLSAGMYFLKIYSEDGIVTKRLEIH